MRITPTRVANLKGMEIDVSGPAPINRLIIVNGTAVFDFTAPGRGELQAVARDTLAIPVFPMPQDQFVGATATASLASISYPVTTFHHSPDDTSPTFTVPPALWAVDSVDAAHDGMTGVVVTVNIVAVGAARIFRVGFQANIMAKV